MSNEKPEKVDRKALGESIKTKANKLPRKQLDAEGDLHKAFSELARELDRHLAGTSVHDVKDKSYGDQFVFDLGSLAFTLEKQPLRLVPGKGFAGPMRLRAQVKSSKEFHELGEFLVVGQKVVTRGASSSEDGAHIDFAFEAINKFLGEA